MSDVRVHLLISGRVQGVSFRAFTQSEARKVGVTGWVRNLSDGRVEAVAEGAEEDVEKFVAAVRRGPSMARVEDVRTERREASGEFTGFSISF